MADSGPRTTATSKVAKRGIGAIETGLRLIDALADAEKPMQLKDLAARAGMPAAKAHRYLASFIAAGMVRQPEGSNRYELGPMALRIGVAALNRFDIVSAACAGLPRLRDRVRATCFVTGWSDRGPIILRWEDSRRPVTVIVQTGSTMPLLTSATGRAFLAFLPREQTDGLVAQELGTDAPAKVEAIVGETRRSGLGRTDGAFQPGISALAAPLYDHLGSMVGAVAALGRSGEFNSSYQGPVAMALRDFARQPGEQTTGEPA